MTFFVLLQEKQDAYLSVKKWKVISKKSKLIKSWWTVTSHLSDRTLITVNSFAAGSQKVLLDFIHWEKNIHYLGKINLQLSLMCLWWIADLSENLNAHFTALEGTKKWDLSRGMPRSSRYLSWSLRSQPALLVRLAPVSPINTTSSPWHSLLTNIKPFNISRHVS